MDQSVLVLGKQAAQTSRYLRQILVPASSEATRAMLGKDVT